MLSIWSVCLVFCDCGFHSICSLSNNGKRLFEASWWELWGKWSCSDGQGLAQQIFNPIIQFSVDGWGCVPSQLFDLRPKDGRDNEDNGDLLQKVLCMHCHIQYLWPCSRSLPVYTSAETPGHSQASLGQSLVGSLPLSPGSWRTQDFVCALQESVSPFLCKFWWLYCGFNGNLLQECSRSVAPSIPAPVASHLHRRHWNTQSHVWLSLCGVSCCTQVFVWPLWVTLAGMRFDSKCNFALPTIFWRLLLCLCTGLSFFSGIQHSPEDGCSAASCKFEVLNWCQMKNNTFLKYDHEYYHYFMYLLISYHQ